MLVKNASRRWLSALQSAQAVSAAVWARLARMRASAGLDRLRSPIWTTMAGGGPAWAVPMVKARRAAVANVRNMAVSFGLGLAHPGPAWRPSLPADRFVP